MVINNLLKEKNMSQYKLSKLSGVSQSTISDICNGKVLLAKCSVETLRKIAKALNVSIDSIVDADEQERIQNKEYRSSFETYKSNICHYVKDMGDLIFIANVLKEDAVRKLYEKKWYPECLYLLAMIDYLSRINKIPLYTKYNDIRKCKLTKTIYPSGIIVEAAIFNDKAAKIRAKKESIPEFMRFNIVECEVKNLA